MHINVTYGSTVTGASNAAQIEGAVQAAVQFYEHAYTNNVTLNIDFEWAPLSAGSAASNTWPFNYVIQYSALQSIFNPAHATSADQATAWQASVPSSNPTGSGTFEVTQGYAKMLGLATQPTQFDDVVTLNSNLSWSFNPSDRSSGGGDAIGALEHEISEGGMGRFGNLDLNGYYMPLDLFRYTSSNGQTVRDLSPNNADYFSIDGRHLLEEYNVHGLYGGDVSDWFWNPSNAGVSIVGDSFGTNYSNTVSAVTPTDLREMNVLGWTRAPATIDDFNGDAVSDIPFYDPTNGDLGYWSMQGQYTGWHDIGLSSTAYSVVGIGDFNHDFTDDILFRNNSTGAMGIYLMSNGGTGSGSGPTQGNNAAGTLASWDYLGGSNPSFAVVGVGDFFGNGTDNILFRDSSGNIGFYSMSNGAVTGWHVIGGSDPSYAVVGVGDFFGTGTSDILFRNNSTGNMGIFDISNGAFTRWDYLGGSDASFSAVGIGDFDGNGTSDILFRNASTGEFGYYSMTNGAVTGWHVLGSSPTNYSVVGIGDYYGNGIDDILFRDSSGNIGFDSISNGQVTGWHFIAGSSTAYNVLNDLGDNGVAIGDIVASDSNSLSISNNVAGNVEGFGTGEAAQLQQPVQTTDGASYQQSSNPTNTTATTLNESSDWLNNAMDVFSTGTTSTLACVQISPQISGPTSLDFAQTQMFAQANSGFSTGSAAAAPTAEAPSQSSNMALALAANWSQHTPSI